MSAVVQTDHVESSTICAALNSPAESKKDFSIPTEWAAVFRCATVDDDTTNEDCHAATKRRSDGVMFVSVALRADKRGDCDCKWHGSTAVIDNDFLATVLA